MDDVRVHACAQALVSEALTLDGYSHGERVDALALLALLRDPRASALAAYLGCRVEKVAALAQDGAAIATRALELLLEQTEVAPTEQGLRAAERIEDPWEAAVCLELNGRDEVAIHDLLRGLLGLDRARWSRRNAKRVEAILRRRGWVQRRKPFSSCCVWVRPEADAYMAAKTRREQAEAELAEAKVKQLRGEVVSEVARG